ncbi:MAG: cytochrome c3 family protein [Deltaproteobacteria bacterium]
MVNGILYSAANRVRLIKPGGLLFCALAAVFSAAFIAAPDAAYSAARDLRDLCLGCHKEVAAYSSKAVVHRPVKEGQCTLCHSPHASKHQGLLKGDGSALCYGCHDKKNFAGGVSVHKPVMDGKCSACHNSHASDAKGLLKKTGAEICYSCHPAEDFKGKKHVHPEVKKGNCTLCHNPHTSNSEGLLAEGRAALCAKCHKTVDTRAHWGYDVAGSDCFSCHSPHSSDRPALIKATLHKPFEEKKCSACHIRGAKEVSESILSTCASCHKATLAGFNKIYSHLISGADTKSCSACHAPHASDGKKLLRDKETRVCFSCHFSTRDSIGRSKVTHPKLEMCTSCHTSHGSNDRYFLSSGNGGCSTADCHPAQGTFTHPVGDKIIDPRSKTPMTCVTCHSVMGASEEFNLRFKKDVDLCVQCHQL